MLPVVTRVTMIESYRDGGSLSISFDGEENHSYRLFFRVNLQRQLVKTQIKSQERTYYDPIGIGYLPPILEIRSSSEQTDEASENINQPLLQEGGDIDRCISSLIKKLEVREAKEAEQTIEWEEAKNLLETMKPLVENFSPEDDAIDEEEKIFYQIVNQHQSQDERLLIYQKMLNTTNNRGTISN
jgi:hypothetical protein